MPGGLREGLFRGATISFTLCDGRGIPGANGEGSASAIAVATGLSSALRIRTRALRMTVSSGMRTCYASVTCSASRISLSLMWRAPRTGSTCLPSVERHVSMGNVER